MSDTTIAMDLLKRAAAGPVSRDELNERSRGVARKMAEDGVIEIAGNDIVITERGRAKDAGNQAAV